MSNYIEYKDRVTFHPGYYIKEIIDDMGLSQEDFARRLGTTPKTLSVLINGGQGVSPNLARRLSNMLGTSDQYWLNLQAQYDAAREKARSAEELEEEKSIVRTLGYRFFVENFGLPSLPRMIEAQVVQLRSFLGVGSLTVLKNPDLAASFRTSTTSEDQPAVIKANAMVQIAVNEALKVEAPRFDRPRFEGAVRFALTQTCNHDGFYEPVKEEFRKAGVILVILPNIGGSKTNGATKRLDGHVMLMVNDRFRSADSFWFTLLHEVGHIMAGDFGVSVEGDSGSAEDAADAYARDTLIEPEAYRSFVAEGEITPASVKAFAESIDRDPGIVVGRLQREGRIRYGDGRFNSLQRRYRVVNG